MSILIQEFYLLKIQLIFLRLDNLFSGGLKSLQIVFIKHGFQCFEILYCGSQVIIKSELIILGTFTLSYVLHQLDVKLLRTF